MFADGSENAPANTVFGHRGFASHHNTMKPSGGQDVTTSMSG